MSSAASFISRYWRIIVFIIAMILVFWVVWSLLNVLLPFLLGMILAYLLLPVMRWVERRLPGKKRLSKTKRISLIVVAYLIVLAAIGLAIFYTLPFIINSVTQFVADFPQIISDLQVTFQNQLDAIRAQLPPQIQAQLDNYVANIGTTIAGAFQSGASIAFSYLSATFGFVLGFATLPVFLFFLLMDAEKLNEGFYAAFSPWWREHTREVVRIISNVLGKYIRASIILGLAVGIVVYIGLMILGVPFAPVLALWAGLTEMIPVLGPWLGGAAGGIVVLAMVPDKLIWVIVLYFGVQMVEANLLVPRIQSQYLNLHPAVILVLIILGAHFAGFWGIVLIAPLAAVFVQLYRFIIRSIREEGLKRE